MFGADDRLQAYAGLVDAAAGDMWSRRAQPGKAAIEHMASLLDRCVTALGVVADADVGPDGAALIERLNLLSALLATALERCGSLARPGERQGLAPDPRLQAEFERAIVRLEEPHDAIRRRARPASLARSVHALQARVGTGRRQRPGLAYIVADPRPRVNAQPNPGRATPYQHLLQQIKRASHDVAALMVERDVGPDEKTASSLSLPTVKTCLQHIEFWSGQSLGPDWPTLPGLDEHARIAPERGAESPGPFDWIQAMVQKKITAAYAELPADADLSAMLAAVARLGRDTETLPESLGGEYADVVRQLFRLETARLAFAQTLGASGFAASSACVIRCGTAIGC